jgi:hypothetical protein
MQDTKRNGRNWEGVLTYVQKVTILTGSKTIKTDWMNLRYKKIKLPVIALLIFLAHISGPLIAQFEQKLSINLSGGYFNTMGKHGYVPEWAGPGDEEDPTLMPNFRGGYSFSGGLQYNMSRHFSIEIGFGIMKSNGWYFDYSDDDADPFNYLYYEVVADPEVYDILETGEDEMMLSDLWVGIAPRYYFRPGSKLNPFLFAGLNLGYFSRTFVNNQVDAYAKYDLLDVCYEYNENTALINWFEDSYCVGPYGGAGVEYTVNDYLGFFAQASYYFARLQDDAFHEDMPKQAGFHGLNLHLGARISFLRSKDL